MTERVPNGFSRYAASYTGRDNKSQVHTPTPSQSQIRDRLRMFQIEVFGDGDKSSLEVITDEEAGFGIEGETSVFFDAATAYVALQQLNLGDKVTPENIFQISSYLTNQNGPTLFSKMSQIKDTNKSAVVYTMNAKQRNTLKQAGWKIPDNNVAYAVVSGFSDIGEKVDYRADFEIDSSLKTDKPNVEYAELPEKLRQIVRNGNMKREFAAAIYNIFFKENNINIT